MKIIGHIGQQLRRALNEQRDYVSADELSDAIWQASCTVFGSYVGHVALYRPGQPLPPRAYGISDRINTALAPFLRTQRYSRASSRPAGALAISASGHLPFPITTTRGNQLMPLSFQHPTALRIPGARKITALNQNAVAARVGNSLSAPTKRFPIRFPAENGYRVLPVPDEATLEFLAAPPQPVFAEKPAGDNSLDLVYDDENSVDIGWVDVTAINEIIAHATRLLGGQVKDAQATQLATQTAQMGA